MMSSEAIPRHLVFVLEDDTVVIQRGAALVEVLETRETRSFGSFDHHHDITDEELALLQGEGLVLRYDDATIWLPAKAHRLAQDMGKARYYFLDTRLSAPYLRIVQSLLDSTDLHAQYEARLYGDRVAIMASGGEPFSSLQDAEAAQTLLAQALGKQLVGLVVERVEIDTTLHDTQLNAPARRVDLISTGPLVSLADRTVVLVEDDEALAEVLALTLRRAQPNVLVAHTGEIGLEIITDEEPDLVLLDLNLPDMHGYEVIARLKKDPLTARTPIIVMSGNSSETDMVFALYVAKVDDYLVKPVEPRVIRRRVLTILTRQT
ncbi:MAG: response regulator [Anaerolineae bacterium]|nr:response regulator [Anaerolineae bacterium]